MASRRVGSIAFLALMAFAPQANSNATVPQADAASLRLPEAKETIRVFREYMKARNDFDSAKADLLEADDVVWYAMDGSPFPKDKQRNRDIIEWEKALGTKWTYRLLEFKRDVLFVETREENQLYRILGVGAVIRQQSEAVRDGKLREVHITARSFTAKDLDAALADFKKWLLTLDPAKYQGVLADGHFVYNGESGRKEMILLRDWKRLQNS